MKNIKVYLDICCFNRPYDDQTQMRIQFETAAKLIIQSLIVEKQMDFAWSYVLEFENARNPFPEKDVQFLLLSDLPLKSYILIRQLRKLQRDCRAKVLKRMIHCMLHVQFFPAATIC